MYKPHAVGILCCDRFDLTEKVLESLYYSDQPGDSYDLFLIDNGSSKKNLNALKKMATTSLLPIKNLFSLNKLSISQAWNLFLMVTKDYPFRTIVDNDIVFYDTPIELTPPEPKPITSGISSGGMVGVNPGAPQVASIKKSGDGMFYPAARRPSGATKEQDKGPGSLFLDYLQTNATEMKAGLVSLVPVIPKVPFINSLQDAAAKRFDNRPYLCGGCMMITYECFAKLGYFDERLTRFVVQQYSQRALLQRINISYHPSYWIFHIGHDNQTNDPETYQTEGRKSYQILQSEPTIESFLPSKWESVFPKIAKAASSIIVNLI